MATTSQVQRSACSGVHSDGVVHPRVSGYGPIAVGFGLHDARGTSPKSPNG